MGNAERGVVALERFWPGSWRVARVEVCACVLADYASKSWILVELVLSCSRRRSFPWVGERQFSGGFALGNPNIVLHVRLHMQAIFDLRAGLEAFDAGNATLGGEHEDGGRDCRM